MAASICLAYALTRAALPCALNLFQLHMLTFVSFYMDAACRVQGTEVALKKSKKSKVAFVRSFRFRALRTNFRIVSMKPVQYDYSMMYAYIV